MHAMCLARASAKLGRFVNISSKGASMRRQTIVLVAIGVALGLAATLWALLAPGLLVKYPDDLDQTAIARGTVTLFVDPSTGAPTSNPRQLPLAIDRNLRVVDSTGSEATVQERSVERIGNLPAEQLQQRYVIDRGSIENLQDPAAYAYTPDHVVNRAGAFSINLPFATGAGPYPVWKNETATTYTFRQAGDTVERHGLTLRPMQGRMTNTVATDAYIQQLAPQGLRKQMTLAQLAPQLKAAGLDAQALTEQLLPELSRADQAALRAMLSAPVPIKYLLSADTRLLVEPTTGAIVSLDRIDQTISAVPDLSRLAGLGTMLAKPEYADSAAVQASRAALGKLAGPEPTRVLNLRYGQTDASVADIAAYVSDKADGIRIVKTLVPAALVIAGALTLLGAILTQTRHKRVAA
jgi:hypothetical protein